MDVDDKLIGAYFYTIWITINCDNWSKKLFNLINLGTELNFNPEVKTDTNYYILIIAVINIIVNIAFEWFVMRLINNCFENRKFKKYKEQIEEERLMNATRELYLDAKDVSIYKYNRVYYHDRRKNIKEKNKLSNFN